MFRRQNGPKRRHGRRSEVTGTRGARARSRVSYANVTASLALFVALGGTAAAAMTLPRDSVGSTQIRTNAVRASDIAKDAVQSRGIAKDPVGSSEIVDNDSGQRAALDVTDHLRTGTNTFEVKVRTTLRNAVTKYNQNSPSLSPTDCAGP